MTSAAAGTRTAPAGRATTRRLPAVLLAIAAAGCGLSPHRIVPDPALQPEVARFRSALAEPPADQDLERFARALTAIHTYHVDPVDAATLVDRAIVALPGRDAAAGSAPAPPIDAAIAAMAASLDDRSEYLDPELYREMHIKPSGTFGSVGLELTMRNGELTVVSPIEGGPAWLAGIEAEDVIVAIDGQPATTLTLVQAIHRLRGPVGTDVTLTVRRHGSAQARDERFTRQTVRLKAVSEQRLPGGFGYIRISQFGENTSFEVGRALYRLASEDSLRGLVLDLRDNSGGLLSQATETADLFLRSGLVVHLDGRSSHDTDVVVSQLGKWHGFRMIVLVDDGTAAGAEILAAALQYHHRATIMGSATAGTGTVQTIIPIADDAALRLTTHRAYAPGGRAIASKVEPETVVPSPAARVPSPASDPVVQRALEVLRLWTASGQS